MVHYRAGYNAVLVLGRLMASRWADGLPRETIPMTLIPKPVTVIYPYYDNAGFFRRQLDLWASYPLDLRAQLHVIVVDDGSTIPAYVPVTYPVPLRLFRIEVDVRWNWLAARNIGAYHAAATWLVLTDMDHQIPEATLRHLIYGQHDPRRVYAFSRAEHDGRPVTPHSASFFLTRDLFWTIGGYDEALSGYYGTDGEFRRRVQAQAMIGILPDVLIRYEQIGDSSTIRYGRKERRDTHVRTLIASRKPGWRPKVLSFPYHEVTR